MRCKAITANGSARSFFSSHLVVQAAIFLLAITASAAPLTPSPKKSDDVKKLIKQAGKLTRAGSLTEAETLLRQAAGLDTSRLDAKIELAYVLTKQRRLAEAYQLAFDAARADSKNSRAFAVLGATLVAAGNFSEARVILNNAITLNKKEDLAWAWAGMLDYYENDLPESLENLKTAVHYMPDEPDYIYSLAQVSARAENYQDAASAYEEFLRISDIADADRRARIKGLVSFLRYLGNISGLYQAAGSDQTTVPFDLVGNRPVIKVRVNGKPEPLRFVLDTGSGISVVSETTAKRLKIKPITRGGFARGLGGDGKFEIVYGLLHDVSIGEVTLRNVPIYLRRFHSESQDIDGYIGLGLISKFLATVDYGDRTFSLNKNTSHKTEPSAQTDVSLPLRLTSSGFLSGQVKLDGIDLPLNFIVDTGASVSVISTAVAKSNVISTFANNERLRVIGSAGITEDVPTFRLPSVSFGKITSSGVMAVALDLDVINEASGFEQAGILGGNVLKNYRLTFNFKNSTVTFISIQPEQN
jgi:tetratricopeptide (TPR) repeat protein